MSPEAQEHCRKIDVVTVKGSSVPMPIYTFDVLQGQTFPQLRTPKYSSLDLNEVLQKQADEYDVNYWTQDQDLIQLRCLSTKEFKNTFHLGLEHYLAGKWIKAKEYFERANQFMKKSDTKGDGPSKTLLHYMESRNWVCPSNWKGYRPLTSK